MMTVTDVLTTCAVVIFRVKVSFITSVNGIKLSLLCKYQVKHETSITGGKKRGMTYEK